MNNLSKKLNVLFSVLLFSLFLLLFTAMLHIFSINSLAADTLTGTVDIYFNNGTLYASYDGELELSSGATYHWFLSGSQKSTGTSYSPTEAGNYYVTLTDSAYSGTIYSDTITLYKITIGTSGISLDSTNGIYEAGDEVTARATLTGTQTVTNWTSTVAGLALPSSGNPITFKMPAQNMTLTANIANVYTVYIYGGTADSYNAKVGDLITITADTVSGKTFEKWVTSGASVTDAEEPVTQFTMPAANVTIRATFVEDTEDDNTGNTAATFTDTTRTLYTVTRSNNYKVDMYHHDQGPECVQSFIFGAGTDYLVTSYWNIVINNDFNIRETPGPITICLTLPADLQKTDRNWRMICVSRDGLVYSFADEDEEPETITFSPDRFYAFALCFNDTPEVVEADGDAEVITVTDGTDETITTDVVEETPITTSTMHSISESQTNTSSSTNSSTVTGSEGQTTVESKQQSIESDKTDAINSSGTTQIPIVTVFEQ